MFVVACVSSQLDMNVFSGKFYFGSQNVLLKVRITFSKNILKMFGDNFLKMFLITFFFVVYAHVSIVILIE